MAPTTPRPTTRRKTSPPTREAPGRRSIPSDNDEALFADIPVNDSQAALIQAGQLVSKDLAECEGEEDVEFAMKHRIDKRYHRLIELPSSGNANTNTNTGTSAFGGGNAAQQPASGSLFGQPAKTNSIFGNNNPAQPQQQQQQQQQSQPSATSSLFAQPQQPQQQQQQHTTSSLFAQPSQQQQPATSSLFNQQQQPATSSLFTQQQQPATSSLFSQPANQTQNVTSNTSSLFNTTARPQNMQSQGQAPSLLGATMRAQANQAPSFGRLGMGQSTTNPVPTVGGVKIDLDNLRSTTRFEDCIDPLREQLEQIDKMIQRQESWAKQIEAFLPKHEQDVMSIAPDVEHIQDKVEGVEQALGMDAAGIEVVRATAVKDRLDFDRCQRILTNLALPRQYQYSAMTIGGASTSGGGGSGGSNEDYDTDLIGNYFMPMAAELQRTMGAYANNLTEIESHMRVIENSAVTQAQQLAYRRSGMRGAPGQANGDDTVRELADTLRGFERSILDAASMVGLCREGVNELVLGRLANGYGGMS